METKSIKTETFEKHAANILGQYHDQFPEIANQLATVFQETAETMSARMTELDPNNGGSRDHHNTVLSAIRCLEHNLRFRQADNGRCYLQYVMEYHNIDFSFGDSVSSDTARLLLKVPGKVKDKTTTLPMTLSSLCECNSAHAPLVNDKTVLIYPNQEGDQTDIKDRPVVQNCAVSPGHYVIIGGITLKDREAINDILQTTLNVPEAINPFLYYDVHAAIEDLAEILQKIRKIGFGNQYETDDQYRQGLVYLPPSDEFASDSVNLSGFYTRNADQVRASAIYVPGNILFGFHPEEAVYGGGFAVIIEGVNYTDQRPVSTNFMLKNYIYTSSGKNVRVPDKVQLAFQRGYPLQPFSRQVHRFLTQIQQISDTLAAAHNTSTRATAPTLRAVASG